MGQKTVSPAAAVFILSLESVFSALSGWIVLRETLTPAELAGCGLLFTATLLSQLAAMKTQPV